MLFDAHTHLNFEKYTEEERRELASEIEASEVSYIIDVADCVDSAVQALKDADDYPWCYAAVGIHPDHASTYTDADIDEIRKLAAHPKAMAIGEIGLDYYYGKEHAKEQKEALHWQLDYASERGKPVNIHLRDAMGDFLEILSAHKGLKGNMHAYSGSYESFLELQKLGDWYIGVGGVVTFKNASLAEVVRKVPLERIVLETDAPYLTPVPYRGRRNESSYIPFIAAKVAELKGISVEEVAEVTTKNARNLFGI